jgi:hypothetical protein
MLKNREHAQSLSRVQRLIGLSPHLATGEEEQRNKLDGSISVGDHQVLSRKDTETHPTVDARGNEACHCGEPSMALVIFT